ncbi:unnamed protein product, partial [Staurois parvus]
ILFKCTVDNTTVYIFFFFVFFLFINLLNVLYVHIVNAGSEETKYSECRVRGDRI